MIALEINDHQRLIEDELEELENYLIDLPIDIKDINELNEIISNNKDMSRAYDLGRKEAYEEFKSMLTEIKKKC